MGNGTANGIIVTKQNVPGGGGMSYMLIYLVNEQRLAFSLNTEANGWVGYYFAAGAISQNTWYHAACVYDGASVKLYLNGQLHQTFSGVTGNIVPATGKLLIGKEDTWQNEYFKGAVSELAIFNRGLSAAEVASLYSGVSVTNGLVVGLHLDDPSGTATLVDYSGHGNNGTVTGSAALVATGTIPGTATFSTPAIAVGNHSITAVYSGDSTYPASTSSAVAHLVTGSLSWDPDGANNGAFGGSGDWNAAGAWVDASGNRYTWDSSLVGGKAVFSGSAGTVTLNSSVTTSGLSFQTSGYTITSGAGSAALALAATGCEIAVASGASATISSVLEGSGALTKLGSGTVTLSGNNTYSGGTTVSQGDLSVTGLLASAVTVASGATLSGSGSTGAVTAGGGSVSPGVGGVGTLNTGNLAFAAGSQYRVDLTSGGQDELHVTGTVNLANATLSASGSRVTSAGDALVLITNDGTDAVTGTFLNLNEGAVVNVGPTSYLVTYCYNAEMGVAGSGNDVALIATNPTVALSSSSQSSNYGESVTFTATVPQGATGSVSFMDGTTTLGTGAVSSSGVATLTVPAHQNALQLDGYGGCVDCGADSSQNVGSQLTLSAWVNVTGTSYGNGMIVMKQGEPWSYSASYCLDYNASTQKFEFCFGTASYSWRAFASQPVSMNTWYHVVGTYDGSSVKLYLNGQLNVTYSDVTGDVVPTSGHLLIGKQNAWSDDYLMGAVSEVAVFNRGLSAQEVGALHGGATVTNGLVAGWHLDAPSGTTTAVDYSGHGNNGTLSSGAAFVATGTLPGTAPFVTPALAMGSHSITAVYSGDSTYSASTSSALVHQVNAPPTSSGSSRSLLEDGVLAFTDYDFAAQFSDADGDSLTTLKITQLPSYGTLKLSGVGVSAGQEIAVDRLADLVYQPSANYYGSDSFQWQGSDGMAYSASATLSITVTSVNDAPSFTAGADQTVTQNSGYHTVSGWATAMSPGASNEWEQSFNFQVTTDRPDLFSMAPWIDSSGTLGYELAWNVYGVATLQVTLIDTGGTANGGQNASAVHTATITVNAIPTVSIASVQNAQEGSSAGYFRLHRDITTTDLTVYYNLQSVSGPTATNGVDFAYLPGTGQGSTIGSVMFLAGQSTVDIPVDPRGAYDDTLLEPTEQVSISLYWDMAGSNSYSVADTNPVTLNITDNDVAPRVSIASFRNAKEGVAAGYFRLQRDVTTSSLTVYYSVDSTSVPATNGVDYAYLPGTNGSNLWSGSVFFDVGQSALDIVVDPRGDYNDATEEGTEEVRISLTPSEGGPYGIPSYTLGTQSSQTLTITDNEGPSNNHRPVVQPSQKAMLEDGVLAFVAADFTTCFTDDDWWDSLQAVQITAVPQHGQLEISGVGIEAGDVILYANLTALQYHPTANYNGVDTFQWKGSDGTDLSDAATTVSIDLTPVNDAPGFTKGADQMVAKNTTGTQTVAGWATDISAGATDEVGQTLTFEVTIVSGAGLFSSPPAVNTATGNLTYAAAPNATGTAMIRVTLHDAGGTANGGVDVSAPQSFTITVGNQVPVLNASQKDLLEDTPYNFTSADFTAQFHDPDAGDTLQRIKLVGPSQNSSDVTVAGVLEGTAGTNEIQRITLGSGTNGFFILTFGNQTTEAIPRNASAATVQAALQSLSTIGDGNVTVTGPVGGPWNVEFQDSLAGTDVALLTAVEATVRGTSDVSVTLEESGTSGWNEVVYIGLPAGPSAYHFVYAGDGFSGTLTCSDATTLVTSLLQAFGGENLRITTNVDPLVEKWVGLWPYYDYSQVLEVEFIGAYAGKHVALETLDVNSSVAEVKRGGGTTPNNETQYLRYVPWIDYQQLQSCTFIYGGQETAVIDYLDFPNAASRVLAALEELFGAGNVSVNQLMAPQYYGSSPYFCGFMIEFVGALAHQDLPGELQYHIISAPEGGEWRYYCVALTQGGAVTAGETVSGNEKQYVVPNNGNPGDTFTLSFSGQTTPSIPFGASPQYVQSLLESLTTIGSGNVQVTAFPTPSVGVPPQNAYVVEFTGALARRDVALLTATVQSTTGMTMSTGLLREGGNPAPANEKQSVVVPDATIGTFTLSFGDQTTTPIGHHAPASVVQAALEALSTIGSGNVSVTSSTPGSYMVEFTGSLGHQDVSLLTADASQLYSLAGAEPAQVATTQAARSATNESQAVFLTNHPTAGTFTLSLFGQTTAALPYNASAHSVQQALEALSAVGQGNVSVTGADGGPWTVGFLGALSNQDIPALKGDGTLLNHGVQLRLEHGTLTLNGQPVMEGQVVAVADIGKLLYSPDPDNYGADGLWWNATDGDDFAAEAVLMTLNVQPVNDAPSFGMAANTITVDEDAAAQTVFGWASSVYKGAENESDQSLTFVVANDNNALFSVQPSVSTDGNLTFTPAPNAHGVATITIVLRDNGGIANGGDDASEPQTFTITINSIDDAPVATSQSVSVNEDTSRTITLSATDVDSPTLTYIVVGEPLHGTLTGEGANRTYRPDPNYSGADTITFKANDGTQDSNLATVTITVNAVNDAPVAYSQVVAAEKNTALNITVTATDVDSPGLSYYIVAWPQHGILSGTAPNNLTYTPLAQYVGADGFAFRANDGSLDSNLATVSITISEVTHIPYFAPGPGQSVNEDAGEQVVLGWARSISSGIPGGSRDYLRFEVVSNTNSDLFDLQPWVDAATGNLVYKPAPNAFGEATISLVLIDDSRPEPNRSVPRELHITVNPINDPPHFLAGDDVWADARAGERVIAGWANTAWMAPGPENEIGLEPPQHMRFRVNSVSNSSLFVYGPYVDAATGTLTFKPAPDAAGMATVELVLYDDGGALGDNEDTSAPQWFNIWVFQSNRAPVVFDFSKTVAEDSSLQFTASDFRDQFDDDDLNDQLDTVRITQLPAGTLVLGTTRIRQNQEIPVAQLGQLAYIPAANFNGTDSFRWSGSDGDDYAAANATVTITVTPVNDRPVAIAQNLSPIPNNVSKLITLSGQDGDPEVQQTLTFVVETAPANGTLAWSNATMGQVIYTPKPGYSGTDSFTFTVTDDGTAGLPANLKSAPATVTIRVIAPNYPPQFTSTPIVDAYAGTTYHYESTASDPDNDRLAFSLPLDQVVWPAGFSPTQTQQFTFVDQDTAIPGGFDERGIIQWNPPAELIGKTVTFYEVVTDAVGNSVSRAITVLVHPAVGNHDPILLNLPKEEQDFAGTGNPATGVVSPSDGVHVNLDYQESQEVTVEVTRRGSGGFGGVYTPPSGQAGKLVVYNADGSSAEENNSAAMELVNALLYGGASGIQVTAANLVYQHGAGKRLVVGQYLGPVDDASSAGVFVNRSGTYDGLGPLGVVLTSGNAADYGSGVSQWNSLSTTYDNPIELVPDYPQYEALLDLITNTTGDYTHYDASVLQVDFAMEEGHNQVLN